MTTVAPALTKLLDDERHQVRAAAARALGHIGPEVQTAIEMLKELAKNKQEDVHKAAVGALEEIESTKRPQRLNK